MNMQGRKKKGLRSAGAACCPSLDVAIDPRLFKALSDPTRIHILVRLAQCRGAQTVTQAAECCSVDLSVVSRHLAILRDAGVLSVRKEGRQMFYEVRYGELVRTLRAIADAVEACCPSQE